MQTRKRPQWVAIVLVSAFGLGACFEPESKETRPKGAQAVVEGLVFVKHSRGACFGVGTTARFDSGARYSNSIHVVSVDCGKAGL
jgi:hypothetical protein